MKAHSTKKKDSYNGFEQGPIRPPSEAQSLLIRITRNCPWNHCTFCPVYKNANFSLRSVDDVIADIDAVHNYTEVLHQSASKNQGQISRNEINHLISNNKSGDEKAFHAALNWTAAGMDSIFLQDANSLVIKPSNLIKILRHLKKRFPWVKRITSYARSHTIARISDCNLKEMADAGLNRIHIGLESGSDLVLKMIKKGTTKEEHIKAGLKVKEAGMELSEYVMPGLGGIKFSQLHATETADALNKINPDFIRLRTLAIPNGLPLFKDYQDGRFQKCTDLMMTKEILLFLQTLDNITSKIKSDHILNLFQELDGKLPDDKEFMVDILNRFLKMPTEQQVLYQVGRRLGIFSGLNDMQDHVKIEKARQSCNQFGITPDNADMAIDEIMRRFI